MGGFPAERALEFFLAGDQNGGIAGAAKAELSGNLAAGDALGDINHIKNGKAAAVADVEGFAGNALDFFEGAHVGLGDIEDENDFRFAVSGGGGRVVADLTLGKAICGTCWQKNSKALATSPGGGVFARQIPRQRAARL
jgi:hypothetical protein